MSADKKKKGTEPRDREVMEDVVILLIALSAGFAVFSWKPGLADPVAILPAAVAGGVASLTNTGFRARGLASLALPVSALALWYEVLPTVAFAVALASTVFLGGASARRVLQRGTVGRFNAGSNRGMWWYLLVTESVFLAFLIWSLWW